MKVKSRILTVIILLWILAPVTRGWTTPLENCIKTAVEKRALVKQYQYQVKAFREKERAARAGFLPSLDLTYSIDWSHVKGAYQYEGESTGAGGGYSPSGTYGYSETETRSTFTATLSYNLFRGFGDYRALKAAKYNTQAQRYLLSAQIADITYQVKEAYIEALRAKSHLRVSMDAVKLLDKQYEDALIKYQVGLITKRDLLKVEVELESARQDLLTSKTNLKKALDTLKRTMGVPFSQEVLVEEVSLPPLDVEDFEGLKRQLFSNRSEIRYYQNLVASLEEEKRSRRAAYFPSIDLSLSYGKWGDDYFLKSTNNGLDYQTRAMVTVKWNLFNGLRDYAMVREAQFKKMAAAKELQEVEKDLALQLRHAIEDYLVAKDRLKVAVKALDEAKEHYRVTHEAYQNGLADTTDLLDARYLLTKAKDRYADAHYDIQLAIATIERILEIRDER